MVEHEHHSLVLLLGYWHKQPTEWRAGQGSAETGRSALRSLAANRPLTTGRERETDGNDFFDYNSAAELCCRRRRRGLVTPTWKGAGVRRMATWLILGILSTVKLQRYTCTCKGWMQCTSQLEWMAKCRRRSTGLNFKFRSNSRGGRV